MNCDGLVYSVSQSATTEFVSLYDEETTRDFRCTDDVVGQKERLILL